MVRRDRFPVIGRIAKPRARAALKPGKELRHTLHGFHLIERLIGSFAGELAAKQLADYIGNIVAERGGGPLTITIGTTVSLEDMPELSEDETTELEAEIHEILENTAIRVVEEAKSLAPVRTGLLRDSISYKVNDTALLITFTADTGYAKYVEYGTSMTAAQPFLADPAKSAEADLDNEIEDAITAHLDGQLDSDEDTMGIRIETTYEGFSESQLAELAGLLAE